MANYTNHPRRPRETLSPHTRSRLVRRGGKKVRESRWLMEQQLGRKLATWEHVHHINGDPLDNRLENMTVLHESTHLREHKQRYPDKKACVVCGAEFMVNPRKRKRNKCCSQACAQSLRVAGRKRQASRKSRRRS